ncbi:hypothetical protein GF406_21185 [candidate division KSB1 bacterium]|jgi:hypothetical protein|nr:hypothetical protein [candidate division KSB1 bacterium]
MLNFDWISHLSQGWARFMVIIPFLIAWIFAMLLPKDYIYLGADDQKPWRNLKLWVTGIVFLQIGIYLIF